MIQLNQTVGRCSGDPHNESHVRWGERPTWGKAGQEEGTNLIVKVCIVFVFVCRHSHLARGNDSCKGGINAHDQRIRKGRQGGVNIVRETIGIPRDPLLVVDNGVVIDENLEPVSVVVDYNARLLALECILKGFSLLVTPFTTGGFTVEHERILCAPDGDVEKDIVPAHNVDAGVVVPGFGWGWVKIKGGGPEDDDSARLELVL